jgi:hypothetical protein
MKMAKASEADLNMAMELANAFDDITRRWGAMVPEKAQRPGEEDSESFDRDDSEQCKRVLGYLLDVADRASLSRVIFGCAVMLDPKNKCVDPDADTIEHHPEVASAFAAKEAQPLSKWHEDVGNVLWWTFPVNEPPWCGQPSDSDWPGYHTHWTRLLVPGLPARADKGISQNEGCI